MTESEKVRLESVEQLLIEVMAKVIKIEKLLAPTNPPPRLKSV